MYFELILEASTGIENLMNPSDLRGFATSIGLYEDAAEYVGRLARDGDATRSSMQEAIEDALSIGTDHRVSAAAHADIGEVGGARWEDLFVGGLDMGVGADYRAHPTIEVATHGIFFTGCFGVDIYEDLLHTCFVQRGYCGVSRCERTIQNIIDEGPTHNADYSEFVVATSKDRTADSGEGSRIIGSAQDG